MQYFAGQQDFVKFVGASGDLMGSIYYGGEGHTGIVFEGLSGDFAEWHERAPGQPLGSSVLWEDRNFRRYQSGQRTVFSGACIIIVLQCVYTWLILQLCGRSGPTGTLARKLRS